MRKPGLFLLIVFLVMAIVGLIIYRTVNSPKPTIKARLVYHTRLQARV